VNLGVDVLAGAAGQIGQPFFDALETVFEA
jgi:hypothetical protein